MNSILSPESSDELVDAVRSVPQLLAVCAGTKPRLSDVQAPHLSTAKLRGIIEYHPSEFTFTAFAGTPVGEIVAELSQSGQYLPFDPMLVDAGATLGGTVMSGLSGPGRFRFGGLRDFILGVRFVDGSGRLLRLGGKVVKNAAGFDLPKFFVGSLGRFGVLAEVTFKVFPRPASTMTLRLEAATLEAASKLFAETGRSRFEFDALDLLPGEGGVWARLAGPAAALEVLSREVFARWPGEVVDHDRAASAWSGLREFRWTLPDAPLAKVALSPHAIVSLGQVIQSLDGARWHLSAGGNVALVSLASSGQLGEFDQHLYRLGLSGVTLRGNGPLWLGPQSRPAILKAVKQALDPVNRFPSLDD
jgi:glycolate oxidase FAD binding subunit